MKRMIIRGVLLSVLFIANLFPSQAASSQAASSKASSSQAALGRVSPSQVAQTADLFIAISLSGKNFEQLRSQIIKVQAKIVQAAQAKGYQLDSSIKNPEDLHITIERIQGIKVSDIPQYEKCIQTAVDSIEAFEIKEYIENSYFDVLGAERRWGVLRFDAPRNSGLRKLVRYLRSCLKKAGLQVGKYDVYIPHISLGTFKKGLMPNLSDASWAPEISIYKGGPSLIVKQIDETIGLHVKDKKTGVVTIQKTHKPFQLKKQEQQECKEEIKSNDNIVQISSAIKQQNPSEATEQKCADYAKLLSDQRKFIGFYESRIVKQQELIDRYRNKAEEEERINGLIVEQHKVSEFKNKMQIDYYRQRADELKKINNAIVAQHETEVSDKLKDLSNNLAQAKIEFIKDQTDCRKKIVGLEKSNQSLVEQHNRDVKAQKECNDVKTLFKEEQEKNQRMLERYKDSERQKIEGIGYYRDQADEVKEINKSLTHHYEKELQEKNKLIDDYRNKFEEQVRINTKLHESISNHINKQKDKDQNQGECAIM